MIVVLESYNSFTHTLVHELKKYSREEVTVLQAANAGIEEISAYNPRMILISSIDGSISDAKNAQEIVRHFAGKVPILGIDEGFLLIAYVFGGKILAEKEHEQGQIKEIKLDGRGLFRSIGSKTEAALYHSFILDPSSLASDFEITAKTSEGKVMGFRHKTFEIEAVLFHPESYGFEYTKQFFVSVLNYRREALPVQDIVSRLCNGEDLDITSTEIFMEDLTDGCLDERQVASILTAFTAKGPSEEEIAGCARVLQKKKTPLPIGTRELTDIVGTGGDSKGSFNISSMAALVAASCGLAIAKHGNRAVSSKSGSADFYEALGIKINNSPEKTAESILSANFGFLFAPLYHAAMKHAAPVRRALGIKTIMNLIGPLSNPASAAYQMLGVYDVLLLQSVARASKMLGAKRVMVVCSEDGFDEISPCAKTHVFEIDENDTEKIYEILPKSFGITDCNTDELNGGTAEENAVLALNLVQGKGLEAIREAVSLNAGAALYIGKNVKTIEEGYKKAKQALANGNVLKKIEELRELTNGN